MPKVLGLVLIWVHMGGNQPMILSHVHVSLTRSLSLPLSSSLSQINKTYFFKKQCFITLLHFF